jgi:hypothetical protein
VHLFSKHITRPHLFFLVSWHDPFRLILVGFFSSTVVTIHQYTIWSITDSRDAVMKTICEVVVLKIALGTNCYGLVRFTFRKLFSISATNPTVYPHYNKRVMIVGTSTTSRTAWKWDPTSDYCNPRQRIGFTLDTYYESWNILQQEIDLLMDTSGRLLRSWCAMVIFCYVSGENLAFWLNVLLSCHTLSIIQTWVMFTF